MGGIDLFHRVFKPLLFEAQYIPAPSCYHCNLTTTKENCPLICADKLEEVLQQHHQEPQQYHRVILINYLPFFFLIFSYVTILN